MEYRYIRVSYSRVQISQILLLIFYYITEIMPMRIIFFLNFYVTVIRKWN